ATLVATYFSGVVDEDDRIHEGGAPGPLRDVLGLTVEEFDAFPADVAQGVRLERPLGKLAADVEHGASLMAERLWLTSARPLARYTREFYAGDAAIAVNDCGKGKAYYLGTRLGESTLAELYRVICAERGITSPLRDGAAPPSGVEVTLRESPAGKAL